MSDNYMEAIRAFHGAISGKNAEALEYNDPKYVPILEQSPRNDPISRLAFGIGLSVSESTHLLTGFRGNGKSTQLRRLRTLLKEKGCAVILVDIYKHILQNKPIELGDFLLSLAAAFNEAVAEQFPELTDIKNVNDSFQKRLADFFKHLHFNRSGLSVELSVLGLQLKRDPTFKQQLQEKLRGHLSGLVGAVHNYVGDMVEVLRDGDPDKKAVLLVDSLEHIRGIGEDAPAVYNSVVEMFQGQASNLALPALHVVYTVPPYLIVSAPNTGNAFGANAIHRWPNVHVRDKQGQVDENGIATMVALIDKRYPDWASLMSEAQLATMASVSGGDIRDFFRLVRDALLSLGVAHKPNETALLSEEQLAAGIMRLKNDFFLAKDDKKLLLAIHQSKEAELSSVDDLPTLMRFMDGNLIMNYLNGEPWYDVHPILLPDLNRSKLN